MNDKDFNIFLQGYKYALKVINKLLNEQGQYLDFNKLNKIIRTHQNKLKK